MRRTVIQFGEGNFLRGFFDAFLDEMNEKGLYDGRAVIVQPRAGGKCALLKAQGCRYNLYLRGVENGEVKELHRLIGAVADALDPYTDFEGYLALADEPDLGFIVSNTTEAGIAFDEGCRFTDRPALSFPGKLTQLLFRRYQNGLPGFILLPCELIERNGDALKSCVLAYARLWNLGDGFLRWVETQNVFANTLVDRIVTGFPDDGTEKRHPGDRFLDTAELFHLWVIEGDFENELPLRKAGLNVVWTTDVSPYKKIKVRVLNGAHTALFAAALLGGLETVGEAMADPVASAFLRKCVYEEILPTIGETPESLAFASHVFDRFRNPFLRHRWRAIALNAVSKFAVRDLPTLLEYREKTGAFPPCLSASLAFLLYFYKNDAPEDDAGTVKKLREGSLKEILADVSLWGTDLTALEEKIACLLEKIENNGAKETLGWILSE